ncbi:MAG: DUF4382 domain-containing protein [Planctomycetes bacterium]|nr:DUF4382 domain-containing protein [Planctomycetota bacterium]
MRRVRGAGGFLALFLVFGGCGGGGGGGPDPASLQVFLTDAPASSLDTFVVTITGMSLVTAGGGEVAAFSGGPVQEDLLDLSMIQQLIASSSVPPGTYTGLKMTVGAISATAAGVPQTVLLAGGASFPVVFQINFETPIFLQSGASAAVSLDFDVSASVTDGGGNTIIVSPVILPTAQPVDADLDEFHATVQSIDAAAGLIQAAVTGQSAFLFVQVDSLTLFESDASFASGLAGLAMLAAGTFVEVKGTSQNGVLHAEKIEIENGPQNELELKGVVTAASIDGGGGAPDTATVKILDVDADPFGDLAGATSVTVNLDGAGFKSDLGSPNVFDVVLGGKVEIEGTFSAGTVLADKVKLKKTRFVGTISAVSASQITLSPLKAERQSIAGLSSRTFDIDANTEISVEGSLAIGTGDLAVGQTVRIKALLDADTGAWKAMKIQRAAAEFVGLRSDVTSITTAGFTMTGDGTNLGLGNPATVSVAVSPETKVVLVQATGCTKIPVADLAGTLSGLAPGATVKVEGVMSGSTLLAAEVVLKP